MAVILALTLVGAGSGAIALPSRPPLDQAHRLVETALGTAAAAANAVTAVASAGLTQLAVSVGAYGLGGLAASPMLLVGFLVGVGASVLALLMVLVVAAGGHDRRPCLPARMATVTAARRAVIGEREEEERARSGP
jgi:hypothetical protein